MSARFITYKGNVNAGTITIKRDGSIKINSYAQPNTYQKAALISPNKNVSCYNYISTSSTNYCHNGGEKVFISSKSKIPRDLLRKNGYKVTYSKEDADIIILPKLESTKAVLYNIAAVNSGEYANFFYIEREDKATIPTTSEELTAIKDKLLEYYPEAEIIDNSGEFFKVFIIPNVEEYEDFFIDKSRGASEADYLQDTDVILPGITKITVEALDLWRHISSSDILVKTVMMSDWSKYPVTLRYFFSNDVSIYNTSPQWLWFKKAIKLDDEDKNIVVTPDDWNMLQAWCLYKVGLEDKGFITWENFRSNVKNRDIEFLRKKVALAPFNISNSETLANIIAALENS